MLSRSDPGCSPSRFVYLDAQPARWRSLNVIREFDWPTIEPFPKCPAQRCPLMCHTLQAKGSLFVRRTLNYSLLCPFAGLGTTQTR